MTSRELEMVKEQQGSRDQELAEIRNSFQASGTRPERFAAFLGHEFKVSFAVHSSVMWSGEQFIHAGLYFYNY